MAWSYCGCECGLDEPTPEEVIAGYQVCPSCGKQNPPRKSEGDLILELINRNNLLEKRVEVFERTLRLLISKDKT